MPDTPNDPSWTGYRRKPTGARKTRRPLGIIIGMVVVVIAAVGLALLLTPHKPAGPGGPGGGRGGLGGRPSVTVGTAQAVIGQIPLTLDALGTVTPPVTATVQSRIAGVLTGVYFTEGQLVQRGQKLAQIDPHPYQVALEQAQGALARDQASLADARIDLKRYQTLLAQDSIASQQVDTQKALVNQDEGTVIADQAAVDNAKLNLAYTSIIAPVTGRVGLRQIDVGNYISVGGTNLVIITQVDPIDVVYSIPEDNVPQIVQRQRQGAVLPATALSRDGSQPLARGSLSTLDNQIDTSTGTVKAKARFDNGDGALFPNQFVNVHMLVDTLCSVVVVPTTAVRHGSQGDFVFTVQPDRTAKMQMVKTGPGTGETVSILSGVSAGDQVITDGGDRLRDGSHVTLPTDQPRGGSFQGRGRRGGGHRGGGQGGGQGGGFGGGAGQGPAVAGSPGQGAPAQGGQGFGGQGQGPAAGAFQGGAGGHGGGFRHGGGQGGASGGQGSGGRGAGPAQASEGFCPGGQGGQGQGAPSGKAGAQGGPAAGGRFGGKGAGGRGGFHHGQNGPGAQTGPGGAVGQTALTQSPDDVATPTVGAAPANAAVRGPGQGRGQGRSAGRGRRPNPPAVDGPAG